MKKTLKFLLYTVLGLVLVLLIALAAHPLWVGPTVKTVAEKIGPKFTGTPIVLESCDVNLYSGHFELIGFDLANPEGCSEKTAAGLSVLKVDFDTLSALSDVINVQSIEVSGIFASYLKGASGKYNFTEIGDNAKSATGGDKSAEVAEGKAEEPKAKEKVEVAKKDQEEAKDGEKAEGKKVIIERLSIGNIKVVAFGMSVPLLPGTIELKDIGKESNGASMSDVLNQTWEQIMKASGVAGQQLVAAWEFSKKYGQMGVDLGKQGLDAGTEGAKKALDFGKQGLDAGTEGAKKALDSASEGLKSVSGSLKSLF